MPLFVRVASRTSLVQSLSISICDEARMKRCVALITRPDAKTAALRTERMQNSKPILPIEHWLEREVVVHCPRQWVPCQGAQRSGHVGSTTSPLLVALARQRGDAACEAFGPRRHLSQIAIGLSTTSSSRSATRCHRHDGILLSAHAFACNLRAPRLLAASHLIPSRALFPSALS